LAANFESLLKGLERREEDCLVIALTSIIPIPELEATVITKIKESGVAIKSEEEIQNMRAEFFQNEFISDEDIDEEEEEGDNDEHEVVLGELGARTNAVGDLGGSSASESTGPESDDDNEEGDAPQLNVEDFFDYSEDMEELTKQCSLEPLEPKEYPTEAKRGFNIIFTFAMLNPAPFEADVQKIKAVLQAIPGIEALDFTADPIAVDTVTHNFE